MASATTDRGHAFWLIVTRLADDGSATSAACDLDELVEAACSYVQTGY